MRWVLPSVLGVRRLGGLVVMLLLSWSAAGALGADAGTGSAGSNSVWWAFRPIQRPQAPTTGAGSPGDRHPVDAFINARLRAAGLEANGRASRRELIRRATLDLTGLPPTFEEVEAFEHDARPEAWERWVDRLLSRPEYGERWGRHWLDVVRFAQSNGYERDGEKAFAWRYRDYVVRALNSDMPYDRFVREHLAGDELEPYSPDAVIATGYARLGVLDDEPDDKEMALFDELDDVLSTTGVAFLGLTLGCARCHDHKFDPISHADYYRLLAFFRGVEPAQHMADLAQSTAHVPLGEPARVREWRAARAERIRGLEAAVAEAKAGDEKKKHQAALEAARKELPPFELALAMREQKGKPEPTFVLKRGNARTPGEAVTPGFPAAVGNLPAPATTERSGATASNGVDAPRGLRRALAEWVASRENPLTARVIVNRVWHHHFGRGLVKTTGDFGRAGSLPTHPELLDWLASEFMEQGWSLKRLHRLILTSDAYCRSSRIGLPTGVVPGGAGVSRTAASVDPANELLWRQNLRRLEAETIRDSMLAVSGQLNRMPGGRGFFPRLSGEVLAGGSRPGTDWELSPPAALNRRSLYAYVRRTQPVPFLEALDYANYFSPLTERPVTTVAPQALLLLNDGFVRDQARALAARARCRELQSADVPAREGVGMDAETAVRRAYRLALSREPSRRECDVSLAFLARELDEFARLRTRLTFRTDVPATMNVSYFDQLKPDNFMTAPAGWVVQRGNWPDVYEANRTVQRGNGPFALWPGGSWTNGVVRARVLLNTAFEGGGLVFGAKAIGGLLHGYELALDPRRERMALIRYSGTKGVVITETSVPVAFGEPVPLCVEFGDGLVRVSLGESPDPRIEATGLPHFEGGQIGWRAWGAALSVDDLEVESAGRSVPILPAAGDSDPDQRAFEAFCLLMLNLNELVYVD